MHDVRTINVGHQLGPYRATLKFDSFKEKRIDAYLEKSTQECQKSIYVGRCFTFCGRVFLVDGVQNPPTKE